MIGNKILHFDILDSTNNYIKRNMDTLETGTVVIAEEQTSGRGRFGNIWISEKGNLYFSFVLKGDMSRADIFPIIMRSSVSIVKVLDKFGIKADIKYPNDIVVDGKKVAGILIESIGYEGITSLIVGIGININQTEFPTFSYPATSLRKESDSVFPITNILNQFISEYNSQLERHELFEFYREKLVFLNKFVLFEGKSHKILEVDENGRVLIESDKTPVYLSYQDIVFQVEE